jgi:hypothetical protein
MRNRHLGSYDWITPAAIEDGAGAGTVAELKIVTGRVQPAMPLARFRPAARCWYGRRQLKTWLALTSCARAPRANEVSGWKLSSTMRRCSAIEYRPLGRFWRLSRCRLDRSSG